jgi:hypothetical protein
MSRALQRTLDRGEAHRHAIERRNEAHDRGKLDASELPVEKVDEGEQPA